MAIARPPQACGQEAGEGGRRHAHGKPASPPSGAPTLPRDVIPAEDAGLNRSFQPAFFIRYTPAEQWGTKTSAATPAGGQDGHPVDRPDGHLKIAALAGVAAFAMITLLIAVRITNGVDLSDEGYYAISPDDWLKGGIGSSTLITLHQTATTP